MILDETDLQILKTLQKNAKLTTKELADAVHLTPTPVFERQKRLEKKGYIKKYVAILDPEKLNLGLQVYCKVKLKQINHEIADAFVRRIQRIPEVTECYNTSGAYDYLLKVRARDMKQYQEFVLNKFLEPMRQRRAEFKKDIPEIYNILKKGTAQAREVGVQTMDEVRKAMRIDYFNDAELIRQQAERFAKK